MRLFGQQASGGKNYGPRNSTGHAAIISRDYSDSLMEMDANIGKVLDEIRADAPNTIVIFAADNGAWLDA